VQQMLPPAVRKLLAMHDKETANLNVSLCCWLSDGHMYPVSFI
jgi:hypothetical protein